METKYRFSIFEWRISKCYYNFYNFISNFVYFSALTILRRLSAQVDHLTRKPKDGERSLKEILSILYENDISPFEVSWNLRTFFTFPWLFNINVQGDSSQSVKGDLAIAIIIQDIHIFFEGGFKILRPNHFDTNITR